MAEGVSKKKVDEVNHSLQRLGVSEADLHEEFIKGSGSGGQKINKTNSCVQLTYLKTGLVIKCQSTRSREQNRFFARRLLLERLQAQRLGEQNQNLLKRRKIRAQKKRRTRRTKEKILAGKKVHAQTKRLRTKPRLDDDG